MLKGHNPSIRMESAVTEQESKQITEWIISTRGGYTRSKVRDLMPPLDNPSLPTTWLMWVSLDKKAVMTWRNGPDRTISYDKVHGHWPGPDKQAMHTSSDDDDDVEMRRSKGRIVFRVPADRQ